MNRISGTFNLTPAEVERIVREHIERNFPGVSVTQATADTAVETTGSGFITPLVYHARFKGFTVSTTINRVEPTE